MMKRLSKHTRLCGCCASLFALSLICSSMFKSLYSLRVCRIQKKSMLQRKSTPILPESMNTQRKKEKYNNSDEREITQKKKKQKKKQQLNCTFCCFHFASCSHRERFFGMCVCVLSMVRRCWACCVVICQWA